MILHLINTKEFNSNFLFKMYFLFFTTCKMIIKEVNYRIWQKYFLLWCAGSVKKQYWLDQGFLCWVKINKNKTSAI